MNFGRAKDILVTKLVTLPPHADVFDAAVEGWAKGRTKYEAMRVLGEAGVPAGACLNAEDLHSDPHLIEREMVVELDHPKRGKVRLLGCPVKLTGSPVDFESAPLLGANNDQVYRELLGFADEELAELREKAII